VSKKKCSICAHPDALGINSALEAGLQQQQVAATFSVSKYALSRHRNRCLAAPLDVSALSGGSEEIARWMRRADDLYLLAGSNADVRGQLGALTAAFKGIQAAEKQRDKEREEQAKIDTNPHADSVEELDLIVSRYLDSCGDTKCFRCGAPNVGGRYVGTPESGTFPELRERYSANKESN
jgi:hypothetical protein